MPAPKTFSDYVQKRGVDAVAAAVDCSPSHIRNLLADRKRASSDLAIRLQEVSRGEVPGSDLRPDLWRSPGDVPCREAAE